MRVEEREITSTVRQEENKDARANVTAVIWFKRQLQHGGCGGGQRVALCATEGFVAALTGYVSSRDLNRSIQDGGFPS